MPNGMPKPPMISSWSPISNLSQKIEDMVLPWSEHTENKTGDLLTYAPVMHGAGGAHYINILVGSPPQVMPVTLSANSQTTTFPCTGHNEQGFGKMTDPEFAPARSSTHRAATCAADCAAGSSSNLRGFHVGGYGWRKREKCEKLLPAGDNHTLFGDRCVFGDEISDHAGWDAYTIYDQLSTKAKKGTSAEVKMGCQYQNEGFYNMTGLGMLGLGRGKSSNLVSAYVDAGLIKDRQFSVCFSETGGSFMLGKEEGAEEEEDESDATKWVPAPYSGSHWWKVEVTGMRVGETVVAGKMKAWQEGKGTLVDTVNTDTYVPAALAPALKAAFEAATGVEYIEAFGPGQGYAMTEAQVAALPSLFFDLNGGDAAVGGHTLEVKPAAYLAKTAYKDGGYNYRLLVHATDPSGGVLGANALRDHMVTFDDARSRVGFKQADCAEDERERAAAAGRAKPALYKMDGVEYFTRIGARFAVKDRKKFDPLSVTKIPKWTQRECDGDDKEAEMDKEVMDKEMKDGMKMDMGAKAANWTDTVTCIPKGAAGEVGHGGIAPVVTAGARAALHALFEERVATGSGAHGEQPAGVAYKLFQVPVPDRRLLDGVDFANMTVVDSRQLTAAGRMVVCHSVATTWVCHAPTMTFFYAVKAKAAMKAGSGPGGSSGEEIVDVTVMCHADSPEEPKKETICHVTGAGDIAIYPTHYETGLSAIIAEEAQLAGKEAGAPSSTAQLRSSLVFLVAGWLMASAAIAGGFYLGRRRGYNGRDGHGVQTAIPVDDEVDAEVDLDGSGKPLTFV